MPVSGPVPNRMPEMPYPYPLCLTWGNKYTPGNSIQGLGDLAVNSPVHQVFAAATSHNPGRFASTSPKSPNKGPFDPPPPRRGGDDGKSGVPAKIPSK